MYKSVLVAVDGSAHSAKVVDFATDYAAMHGTRLLILSVYRTMRMPESSHSMVRPTGHGAATPDEMRTYAESVVKAATERAQASGAKEVEGFVLQGQIARTIVGFARERGVDAIVLGSRGLGDMTGFLLGSVSHKVTSLAECTCIVVK
ncbi:MAG: universal stress protein [Rhodospirillaceae bacterium]|nr:universal stress protein [Rhodospirillaceae bacterium]